MVSIHNKLEIKLNNDAAANSNVEASHSSPFLCFVVLSTSLCIHIECASNQLSSLQMHNKKLNYVCQHPSLQVTAWHSKDIKAFNADRTPIFFSITCASLNSESPAHIPKLIKD